MSKPAGIVLGFGLVVLIGAGSAFARDDAKTKIDVTGTWNFEVDLGGNSGTPTFTFMQKGEKLTGKYKGQFGEADIKGTLKGKKIEFSFEIGEMGKATYSGTFENGTMKGKANYGDQLSGTFTAKRAKDGEKKPD
jgi:hypothetical protein